MEGILKNQSCGDVQSLHYSDQSVVAVSVSINQQDYEADRVYQQICSYLQDNFAIEKNRAQRDYRIPCALCTPNTYVKGSPVKFFNHVLLSHISGLSMLCVHCPFYAKNYAELTSHYCNKHPQKKVNPRSYYTNPIADEFLAVLEQCFPVPKDVLMPEKSILAFTDKMFSSEAERHGIIKEDQHLVDTCYRCHEAFKHNYCSESEHVFMHLAREQGLQRATCNLCKATFGRRTTVRRHLKGLAHSIVDPQEGIHYMWNDLQLRSDPRYIRMWESCYTNPGTVPLNFPSLAPKLVVITTGGATGKRQKRGTCISCRARFSEKAALIQHVQRLHNKEEPRDRVDYWWVRSAEDSNRLEKVPTISLMDDEEEKFLWNDTPSTSLVPPKNVSLKRKELIVENISNHSSGSSVSKKGKSGFSKQPKKAAAETVDEELSKIDGRDASEDLNTSDGLVLHCAIADCPFLCYSSEHMERHYFEEHREHTLVEFYF